MTKLFLRTSDDYWKNISDKLKNDIEVYEIMTHALYKDENNYNIKENTIVYFNKNIWDHETEGLGFFGWQYPDHHMENVSEKIQNLISENDDIIIIFNDLYDIGYGFYNYFCSLKSKINFNLHIFFYLCEKTRNKKNDTGFLRMIPNVDKCDSVTVFNFADLIDSKDMVWNWYILNIYDQDKKEYLETANELFEDALVEIIRNNDFSKLHSDNKSVFVYNHNSNSFEKHILRDFEIVNPNMYKDEIQEFITPNKGKETCRYLKKLKHDFSKKHKLKEKTESCSYSGDCMGTCKKCDYHSESIWEWVYERKHQIINHEDENKNVTAEICGINRLRLGTDGEGVRSLVIFDKCPLKCKYCINKEFVNHLPTINNISVSTLFYMLKKDLIYFEQTGGGVTFGGGEPLLYADFIKAFKKAYPFINVAVQTSLNTDFYAVAMLAPYVDEWHIDIKDMNNGIYMAYTGQDNYNVIENLKMLITLTDKDKIICRVPHIPEYNTPDDVKSSINQLKQIGIKNINEFEYIRTEF